MNFFQETNQVFDEGCHTQILHFEESKDTSEIDTEYYKIIIGQGQLTVKGSLNRMLPRFQEPILG